jgi:hypothetical protein
MNLEQEENKFDEKKARDLVYFLLKNDIKTFKNLIPEIKNMDSKSFNNLFRGIPFKAENNGDGYNYQVRSRKQFESLIEKFDNFWIILDSWYIDEKYYEYLKELWINYISIENLRTKDEISLETILSSYNIDYKSWPEDIKSDFRKICKPKTNTRILEKKEEYDKINYEFQKIIKKIETFRNIIAKEPDMKIYLKNTNKILENLNNISNNIYENLTNSLDKYETKGTITFMSIISTIKIFDGTEPNLKSDKKSEIVNSKINKNSSEKSKDLNTSNIKVNLKDILENKVIFNIYIGLSFVGFVASAFELNNAINDLNKIDLKNYEERLDKIKNDFNEHKNLVGILPVDPKEALEMIKDLFKKLFQDYDAVNDLIKDICKDIKLAEKHKNYSTIGLIGTSTLALGGIIGGLAIQNTYSLYYGISAFTNILSVISNGSILYLSKNKIIDLLATLDKAKKLRKEILNEMENLTKEISVQVPKFDY